MAIRSRWSGRAALLMSVVGLATLSMVLAGPVARADRGESGGPDTRASALTILIGPVEGLTTAWHEAPAETGIPVGSMAVFQVTNPPAGLEWTGAVETLRNSQASIAICPLLEVGKVRVTASAPLGRDRVEDVVDLHVIETQASELTVSDIEVTWDEVEVDDALTQDEFNRATLDYHFGPSIAAVRTLGPGQYRTSVQRRLRGAVTATPAALAPLVEWRIDGQPLGLGTEASVSARSVGAHNVHAGPPGRSTSFELEAYRTVIISPDRSEVLRENEPITFVAVTEPPGHESEITWMSSTKFGSARPVVGTGPIFVTEYRDTFGYGGGTRHQWIGVKADNAVLGQDQKPIPIDVCPKPDADGPCPLPEEECWCCYDVVAVFQGNAECSNLGIGVGANICIAPCPLEDGGVCPSPQRFIVTLTPCLFEADASVVCTDCLVEPQFFKVP